eukprot:TRINITY_DN9806_c0_g3_i1.p1 TRINITY_DN9806_c0_g3~~TRINITY_DN9806_c0_g3_i1.p1  ORF type:complete len:2218 (+),score=356.66 TRINITY_DN9806_c0_g3_i1:92-6745(+)
MRLKVAIWLALVRLFYGQNVGGQSMTNAMQVFVHDCGANSERIAAEMEQYCLAALPNADSIIPGYSEEVSTHHRPHWSKLRIVTDPDLMTKPSVIQKTVCNSALCRSAIQDLYMETMDCSPIHELRTVAVMWMKTISHCRMPKGRPTAGHRWVTEGRFVIQGLDTESDASMMDAEKVVKEYYMKEFNLTTRTQYKLRVVGQRWGGLVPLQPGTLAPTAAPTPPPLGPCCEVISTLPKDGAVVASDMPYLMVRFSCAMQLSEAGKDRGQVRIHLLHREGICHQGNSTPSNAVYLLGSMPVENSWAKDWLSVPLQPPFFPGFAPSSKYQYTISKEFFEDLSEKKRPICEDIKVNFETRAEKVQPVVTHSELVGDRWLETHWNVAVVAGDNSPPIEVSVHGQDSVGRFQLLKNVAGSDCTTSIRTDLCELGAGLPTCIKETSDDEDPQNPSPPIPPEGPDDSTRTYEWGRRLPCGLALNVEYPGKIAVSLVSSTFNTRTDRGPFRTRTCRGPGIEPPARCTRDCRDIVIEWNLCVEIINPQAEISVCSIDAEQDECRRFKVSDPSVKQHFGPGDNCSTTWTLEDHAWEVCGELRITVGTGAVKVQEDGIPQDRDLSVSLPMVDPCPVFNETGGGGGGSDESCWLIWDTKFRSVAGEAGADSENLKSDLDLLKVNYREVNDMKKVAQILERGTYLPRCIIVPKVKKAVVGPGDADGTIPPRTWRKYVERGGVLITTGGWKQIRGMNSIFQIELRPGFGGNHMMVTSEAGSNVQELDGKVLEPELPILNGMHCVQTLQEGNYGGNALGDVVPLYKGEQGLGAGGDAKQVGVGVLRVAYEMGYATYFAFDWHTHRKEDRLHWTRLLKMVVERQTAMVANSYKESRRLAWEKPSSKPTLPAAHEAVADHGFAWGDFKPLPLDVIPQPADVEAEEHEVFNGWLLDDEELDENPDNFHEARSAVILPGRRLADNYSNNSNNSNYSKYFNPPQQSSTCEPQGGYDCQSAPLGWSSPQKVYCCLVHEGSSQCSEERKMLLGSTAMEFTVDVQCEQPAGLSSNRSVCNDNFFKLNHSSTLVQYIKNKTCLDVEVHTWEDPMVYYVKSDCPRTPRIKHAIGLLRQACNFTDTYKWKDESIRFGHHLEFVESKMVQSPTGVLSFAEAVRMKACKWPLCQAEIDSFYRLFSGCPNSAGKKGKISRISKALQNTMKSCSKVAASRNIRNQMMIKGLDTSNIEEVKTMAVDFRNIMASEIDPNVSRLMTAGVSNVETKYTVRLQPIPSDAVPESFERTVFDGLDPTAFAMNTKWQPGPEQPWLAAHQGTQVTNIPVATIQPKVGSVNVNPSSEIVITFPNSIDIVWYDTDQISYRPAIQIYPKRMEEICTKYDKGMPVEGGKPKRTTNQTCGRCVRPEAKAWYAWYPAETGFAHSPSNTPLPPAPLDVLDRQNCLAREYPWQCDRHTMLAARNDQTQASFLCQELVMPSPSVMVAGEILSIKPPLPLQRNTEYVVRIPKGAVTYNGLSVHGSRNPNAFWEGFPDDKVYSFTTGDPVSSNTKLSLGIGCDDDSHCSKLKERTNSMTECLVAMCACHMHKWRCGRLDPSKYTKPVFSTLKKSCDTEMLQYCATAPKSCGGSPALTPQRRLTEKTKVFLEADGGITLADESRRLVQAAGASPPANGKGGGGAGALTMKGEPVKEHVYGSDVIVPWWIFIAPILATIFGAWSLYSTVYWFIDDYSKARNYDPVKFTNLARAAPTFAAVSAVLVTSFVVWLAIHAALAADQDFVYSVMKRPINADIGKMKDTIAYANKWMYAALISSSSCALMSCAVSHYLIAFEQANLNTNAQWWAQYGLILAGGGICGGAVGWVKEAHLNEIDQGCFQAWWKTQAAALDSCAQYGFEGAIWGSVACAIVSAFLMLIVGSLTNLVVFSYLPQLGQVVRYIGGIWWAWVKSGLKNGKGTYAFVLHFRKIKVDTTFLRHLHNAGFVPGIMTVKMLNTGMPFNIVSTRAHPLNQRQADKDQAKGDEDQAKGDEGDFFHFSGDHLQLDIQTIFDVVLIELYVQDRVGMAPEKVADTTWDPWSQQLFGTFFDNMQFTNGYKACVDRGEATEYREGMKTCLVDLGLSKPTTYFIPNKDKKRKGALQTHIMEMTTLLSENNADSLDDLEVRMEDEMRDSKRSLFVGSLSFEAAHMGPMRILARRDDPTDEPFRRQALGDRLFVNYPEEAGRTWVR